MTYIVQRFEPITLTAHKRVKCSACGKQVRRQRTFTQTLNPFNKLPDGTVKDRPTIRRELREEAERWKQAPQLCTPCEDLRGTS